MPAVKHLDEQSLRRAYLANRSLGDMLLTYRKSIGRNIVEDAGTKVAVTGSVELAVTVHVPRPEQPPPQPVKTDRGSGVAVSVTTVAPGKV